MDIGFQPKRVLVFADRFGQTPRLLIRLSKIEVRPGLVRRLRFCIFPECNVVCPHRVSHRGHDAEHGHQGAERQPTRVVIAPSDPLKRPSEKKCDAKTRNVCPVLEHDVGERNEGIPRNRRYQERQDNHTKQGLTSIKAQCKPRQCTQHQDREK